MRQEPCLISIPRGSATPVNDVCYPAPVAAAGSLPNPETPRHAAVVRVTHWITVISFFALLISGAEIVVSHPRFYWGEVGNVNTPPLFTLHIPSSRDTVPTGYAVLPDQNGWSRYLHFQAAWAAVLTGLVYAISSLWTGHFRQDLFPAPGRGRRESGRSTDLPSRRPGRSAPQPMRPESGDTGSSHSGRAAHSRSRSEQCPSMRGSAA